MLWHFATFTEKFMKAKIILYTSVSLILFFTQSCHLKKGILKFEASQDEISTTADMHVFLQTHPHPTIALRASFFGINDTSYNPNNYIYYILEKELINQGFTVKDMVLFNELTKKTKADNFQKLSDITGVDLILDLTNINTEIAFATDRFYTLKGEERILNNYNINRLGAIIEYKLIDVHTANTIGTYTFYYTPCADTNAQDDCHCLLGYKDGLNKIYPQINFCHKRAKPDTEQIDDQTLENFAQESIQSMLADWKK
jgi:hypothetical protein